MSPKAFLVAIMLAAFAGGFMAGAACERAAADRAIASVQVEGRRALDALQGEHIAREGRTDRAYVARHPEQIAGGVSTHERRN
jgi:hypothetical protein